MAPWPAMPVLATDAAQVEADVLEAGRRDRRRSVLGARVVADLELVDHAAAEDALQVEDRVRRVGGDLEDAGRVTPLAASLFALVVEDADVGRPVAAHLEVERGR